MSTSRLWVRISNCSRLSLSMNGDRRTVNFSMRVGQRHGADDVRAGPLGRLDDLGRRLIEQSVIVGLEADPDPLLRHLVPTRRW